MYAMAKWHSPPPVRMRCGFRGVHHCFSAVRLLHLLQRPSLSAATSLCEPPPSGIIKIFSWNLLAPMYIRQEQHRHCDPAFLEWSYRKEVIIDTLIDSRSDIICLQEVQLNLWDEFFQQLSDRLGPNAGYTAVLQNQKRQHPVGCAVLIRDQSGWTVLRKESRSRACVVVLQHPSLVSATTPQHLYVANVHLESGRDKDVTRYNQIKNLLKRLHEHIKSDGKNVSSSPVVITGDFNDLWPSNSKLRSILLTGEQPDATKLHPWQSLLPLVNVHQQEMPLLTFKGGSVVDYILVSPESVLVRDTFWCSPLPVWTNSKERSKFRTTISGDVLLARQHWPSKDYPSDHLPIGAALVLKTTTKTKP
jgi:endonuclease/exonuclease/phosphatase family metal-dependent hydrolase